LVVIKVDKDICIACGTCYAVCPDFFEEDSNGKSHVKEEYRTEETNSHSLGDAPDDLLDSVEEALDSCPVSAITKEE